MESDLEVVYRNGDEEWQHSSNNGGGKNLVVGLVNTVLRDDYDYLFF